VSVERAALRLFRKFVRFLAECKIHIGCDPQRVEAPALILFPHRPATLCCGLAGILTLRVAGRVSLGTFRLYPSGQTPRGDISILFARAAEKNLPALLRGTMGTEGLMGTDFKSVPIKPSVPVKSLTTYLGGIPTQQAMERELLRMKGEEAFGKIFYDEGEVRRLTLLSEKMKAFLTDEERLLEEQAGRISTADLEAVNHGLILLRDLVWGIEKDILDNIGRICRLAGVESSAGVAPEALPKYRKLNFLLNGLDRLEVRGRDSAGIQISFVAADAGALGGIMTGLRESGFGDELDRRMAPGDLADGSITCSSAMGTDFAVRGTDLKSVPATGRALSFTYKTAEIIGELGRNVRELRKQVAEDRLFHAFARLPVAFETAFTHTRWASVGSITEENCHPIGNFTRDGDMMPHRVPVKGTDFKSVPLGSEKLYPAYGKGPWNLNVVLNGDIDNYQTLREALEAEGMSIAPEVTTDTKIIPLRIEKYLLAGRNLIEAFRRAVGDFEGSHAIAMTSNVEPGKIFLALKGSGQSIYIGITPDRYLFSSELYGLVEETPFFIKMDGERPARPEKPEATGQIAILDQDAPGGGGRHPGALL